MSWFDIIKISNEDAISDAKRFAPEMIEEQKRLDEEENQKAVELANQANKEKYYVDRSQLPRIDDWKFGIRYRTHKPHKIKNYGKLNEERFRNKFFDEYLQFFLTNSELEEYNKVRKPPRYGATPRFPRANNEIDNTLLDEKEKKVLDLKTAAAWRFTHYMAGGKEHVPRGRTEGRNY